MIDYSDYSRSPSFNPEIEAEYTPTQTYEYDPALIFGDTQAEVIADLSAHRKKFMIVIAGMIVGFYFLTKG